METDIKQSEILIIYRDYIKLVSELVKSFNLPNNPLMYSILLNRLINNGYLSYDDKFEADFGEDKKMNCSRGIKVILGGGCCRHISKFHKDVFNELGLYSKEFYCYESSSRFFTKKKCANHVINLIENNNGLCGYDVFNDVLYNFINERQLSARLVFDSSFLTYKPYLEFLDGESEDMEANINRFRESTSKWILHEDYIDMKKVVDDALVLYNENIISFNEEATPLKNKIRHLL